MHFALSSQTKDALRDPKTKEHCKPRVYVLGPDRLKDCLNRCSENNRDAKENWGKYIEKHPSFKYGEDRADEWEFAYLPAGETEAGEKSHELCQQQPITYYCARKIWVSRIRGESVWDIARNFRLPLTSVTEIIRSMVTVKGFVRLFVWPSTQLRRVATCEKRKNETTS